MKRIKQTLDFPVLLIVIGFMLFSIVCWVNYASITFTERIQKHAETQQANNSETGTKEMFRHIDANIKEADRSWYSGIFKKEILSRVDTLMTFFMTGQIASSEVEKGKSKWLFFKSITDGNVIADYEGTNTFSYADMDDMCIEVRKVQEYFEKKGIEYALIIPPNKESIYSEYMLEKYKRTERSRTDILVDYLEKHGINIDSPKNALIDNKINTQLYYPHDTHWNQAGAYVAVKEVLSK